MKLVNTKKSKYKNTLKGVFVFAILCTFINHTKAQQAPAKIDSVTEARLSVLEKQVSLNKPGLSRLVVVGLTTFGYSDNKITTTTGGVNQITKMSSLGGSTYEFSPMFLWRQGKKVLLEFEPSFNNNGLSVNWANISYFALPNLIVRGGYFVLPFGMYTKKLAAGWINKFATDPIGLPTGADYGVGVSGGMYLNTIKWNYDFSITNGMSLMSDGRLQNVFLGSSSRNKTFTGRLGILPFSDNTLELGISGMTGGVANGNPQYQNTRANLYAFDFNFVKNFLPIQVNVKSQFNVVNIGSRNYVNPSDTSKLYTFKNQSTSGYGQLSIRPIGAKKQFLKNLELAFRYNNYTSPSKSIWGSNTSQIDYGINYWITWRTVLRVTYEVTNSKSVVDPLLFSTSTLPADNTKTQALHFQFSIQL